VTVDSPAAEAEIIEVLDWAGVHSPWLSNTKTAFEPRLQKRIQRYGWDRASEQYAYYWQTQLEPVQTRLLELADLQAGEKVLDVACGDGLVSFRAREAVEQEGTVTDDDISEEMIRRADFLRLERGLENMRFVRRDAEAPVGAERSFDAALCSLGLMYVPEPEQALRAMFEALRPGSRAEVFPIIDAKVKSEACPLFLGSAPAPCWRPIFRRRASRASHRNDSPTI